MVQIEQQGSHVEVITRRSKKVPKRGGKKNHSRAKLKAPSEKQEGLKVTVASARELDPDAWAEYQHVAKDSLTASEELRAALLAFNRACERNDPDAANVASAALASADAALKEASRRHGELHKRFFPPSPEGTRRKANAQKLREVTGVWLGPPALVNHDAVISVTIEIDATRVYFEKETRSGTSDGIGNLWAQFYPFSQDRPDDPVSFVYDLMHEGIAAVRDVAADFLERVDLNDVNGNTLSFIGEKISRRLRAAVLWRKLREQKFSLVNTARVFRIRGGATAVRREIDALGLRTAYSSAIKSLGSVQRPARRK